MSFSSTTHHCRHSHASRPQPFHHHHHQDLIGRKLNLAIVLTLGLVIGEAWAGISARSLALVSDAGHNLADVLSLGVTWLALRLQQRPPTPSKTFGFQRIGILAAFINAGSLSVIALFILWEGVERLLHPQPPDSRLMLLVAGASLALNGAIAWSLFRESRSDLNLRSAFLHMVGDAVSAAGILAAAVVIHFTGWIQADAVTSLLIGLGVCWSSWSLLRESTHLLLEGTPTGVCIESIQRDLSALPGVRQVRRLHVWGLSSQVHALSCHLDIDPGTAQEPEWMLRDIERLLQDRHRIGHTTVQLERYRVSDWSRHESPPT